MLITPHFLTGVAISQGIPETAPAALAAVSSHFVLDAIPHRDTVGGHHLNTGNVVLVLLDGLLALALWWWLVPETNRWYAFTIGMFACLPDLFEVPGIFWEKWNSLPIQKQFHHWHGPILQFAREPVSWGIGLLPQILMAIVAIYFIVR